MKGWSKTKDGRTRSEVSKSHGFGKWMKGRIEGNIGTWKGDKAKYDALHKWVYSRKGKPSVCEKCGSTKSVQWANKSGMYKRILNDWIRLCAKCHSAYDKNIRKKLEKETLTNRYVRKKL